MKERFLRSAIAVALLLAFAASPAAADTIRIQSTTDTVDAGLVDDLLRPMYAQAQPGDTLSYTAVGTGAALTNARNGLADVVITHAPTLEQQFIADGFSLEPLGRAIFYSDYVIVGPRSDPAGVRASSEHDAVAAFEAIARAGGAGDATFVSRGDNSGTNVQEQLMWGFTTTVAKQAALNAGGAAGRFEPGAGGTYPSWYVPIRNGQAANLLATDACVAGTYPNGGCYTMVDRGTFNRLLNSGTITNLAIVAQDNAAGVRGGKDLLINPFSMYVVNPLAVAARTTVNVAAAQRFVDFMVSRSFQQALLSFPSATDPAFRPDAFPQATVRTGLPASATAGTRLSLSLHLANAVPGTPAVDGLPVQLQQSTDGGRTWTDAGAAVPTDASGDVTLTPTIAATTSYRLSLPLHRATSWNAFSPSTQDLGVVSVAAAPPPPRRLDRSAPRASRVGLSPRKLTLRLDETGSVRATIAKRTVRRARRNGRLRTVVTFRVVRSASARATSAGTVTLAWRRALPPGRYRIGLRTRDAAGNTRVTRLARIIAARGVVRR